MSTIRHSTTAAALLLWLVSCHHFLLHTVAASEKKENTMHWKKRQHYPEYCSSPESMQHRSIPELVVPSNLPDLELLQSIVVIRHGSRTPWAPYEQPCWDGYQEDWDCDLTTITGPNPRTSSEVSSGEGDIQNLFVFEKIYDGLKGPLANELGGSCQKGQLLQSGYDQEVTNGMFLRDAYVRVEDEVQSRSDISNVDGKLFDSVKWEEAKTYDDFIYFRSDDEQRTLLSGQALLSGMFDISENVIVKLHTADYKNDILDPNPTSCPRLDYLEDVAKNSTAYSELGANELAVDMENILAKINGDADIMLDCIMTSICNDLDLPSALDDFTSPDEESAFSRMEQYWANMNTYNFIHDDGAYSKLAMGPIWSDIKDVLMKVMSVQSRADMETMEIPKMYLISAHDTTILPILVSLDVWDHVFPPYASMIVIESYSLSESREDFPSQKAFRLLYNGEAITSRMKGCDDDLCKSEVLLDQINEFATWSRDCAINETEQTDTESDDYGNNTKSSDPDSFFDPNNILFTILLCILSSISTFVVTIKFTNRKHYNMIPKQMGSIPSSFNDMELSEDQEII